MTKTTQPWGWSKLDVHRECPQKFKFQFIDKLPQPSSPAMERGGKLHNAIESYLNGWASHLPMEIEAWREAFDELKKMPFKGEQALGIDKNWNVLRDWFQPETWLRAKMDAYVVLNPEELTIFDWKTGKYRIPSTDQIELYSVVGLSVLPTAKKVTAEFWFVDTNDIFKETYTADQLIKLRKKYEAEANKIYNEEQWKPTPSEKCRYCPYSKTKGGPCVF